MLHLRRVGGEWLVMPPNEWKEGSVHYGGRTLASEASESATPIKRDVPDPTDASLTAARRAQLLGQLRVADARANVETLAREAQANGGRIPALGFASAATRRATGVGEIRNETVYRLNPKLVGRPLAPLLEYAGLKVLIVATREGRFEREPDGRVLVVTVGRGAMRVEFMRPELLAYGDGGLDEASFGKPPASPSDVPKNPGERV